VRAVRSRLACLGVVALALWCAPAASALPGDAPVSPLTPADGASLPTAATGIPVSYACPIYRVNDFGAGVVRLGDERDYVVLMSASPALDAEGRLADPVARVTGSSTPQDPNTCNVLLAADAAVAPQETPGTWYWQVSRLCAGCSPPFETGPVRRVTLVSDERPTLGLPSRPYAGFPFVARIGVRGAPAGTAVVVERRAGRGWVAAGRGATAGTGAEVTTTLPAGTASVRVRLRVGAQTLLSASRRVRVRSARGARRRPVAPGAWAGSGGVAFTVSGRTIRSFAAQVPLLCPTPGLAGQFTTQIARASVPRIRLAPDGSFLGVATRSGAAVRVRGRLRGSAMTGGRVEMSLGGCVGGAQADARPR
jgi:hypothetical protein